MKLKRTLFAAIAASAATGAVIFAISTRAAAPDTTADAGTSSSNSASLFPDPVIAKGAGVQVKRSDLDNVVTSIKSAYAAQGATIPPDRLVQLEAQALEDMINVQLLDQKANDADKAAGEKEADKAMATLLKRAGSQDVLNMQLTAAGTSEAQLRKKVADEETAKAALERQLGVTVSDADVQKYYEDHPQNFEVPEMVHVRDILFLTIDPATHEPLSDDAVAAKMKQADDVLAKAKSGEDFSKLAEQYSEDPISKDNGGELPAFPRSTAELRQRAVVPPEAEAAAFSLTNNQVSDLVKTVYGYYILQLIDKVPAKKLALADKVQGTDTTVAQDVKDGLKQEKTGKLAGPYLVKLKQQADVKILDPDLNSAVESMLNTNAPAQ